MSLHDDTLRVDIPLMYLARKLRQDGQVKQVIDALARDWAIYEAQLRQNYRPDQRDFVQEANILWAQQMVEILAHAKQQMGEVEGERLRKLETGQHASVEELKKLGKNREERHEPAGDTKGTADASGGE